MVRETRTGARMVRETRTMDDLVRHEPGQEWFVRHEPGQEWFVRHEPWTSEKALYLCVRDYLHDPWPLRPFPKPFRLRRLNICMPALVSKLPTQPSTNILHFVQRLCAFALGIEAASSGIARDTAESPPPDASVGGNARKRKMHHVLSAHFQVGVPVSNWRR